MLGSCWAHRAGAIGRRRGQRRAGFFDQSARDLRAGDAQRQRVETGAGEQADAAAGRRWRDDRQRTRPKSGCEPFSVGVEPRLLNRGFHAVEMRDQRIESWTTFGGVDFGDGGIRGRKAGQAVNGFGRHTHEAAGSQDRCGLGNSLRVGVNYSRPPCG